MKEKKNLSKQLFYFYDVLFDLKMRMCDAFLQTIKMACTTPE